MSTAWQITYTLSLFSLNTFVFDKSCRIRKIPENGVIKLTISGIRLLLHVVLSMLQKNLHDIQLFTIFSNSNFSVYAFRTKNKRQKKIET